ncbi:MAG: MgtC/SapB family protein [Thermomicrobiales bacterium]
MEIGPSIQTNWGDLWYLEIMLRLALATTLGLIVGIERERREHAAGMRTHALVAVGSAMFMLVSTYGFPLVPEGSDLRFDPGRIAAQVVSGIGFLGAGVIFTRRNTVHGLTTAASVWAVCGIGLASGGGLYILAVAGTIFMLAIQGGLRSLETQLFPHRETRHRITVEGDHALDLLPLVRQQLAGASMKLRSIEFDRDDRSGDILQLTLDVPAADDIVALIERLSDLPGVHHVAWQHGPSRLAGDRTGVGPGSRPSPEEDDPGNERTVSLR